ncbi:aminopeptidase N [Ramlibacter solisilvae]|uniref:Aminopeptidase N n=1 Tax=Ramlibacter tataouinensis TaxID=94132 RepID=A0A127JXA3_9BURK|nr:aminopeptidase N [Ramlibacter tataouinensis]AMO24519.1 aminopeptidase N [Ramlibacter tataouinensis]
MEPAAPSTVYLKDYRPPAFLVSEVELDIDLLGEDEARVAARLALQRNPAAPRPPADLELDIDEIAVESVAIDGQPVGDGRWAADARHLTVKDVPAAFELRTVTRIRPRQNTKLMGIYLSGTGFFSLCEAEGFRRITPFLDRPDVMARYTATLHADKARYPVLLANGNCVGQGDEAGGRHWARWRDPFPKPSYLFAVVAADLESCQDRFRTRSGRDAQLQCFVEPGKLDQIAFALESLKHAMKWDEDRYGLEIDLDEYNVVAVGDFNAGAMENKGLNIFNTKLVLARPDISTDWDFSFIDRTVAHEYFHNWTGNRVTCRDWFQLSLKEGLTVFREQQYAADRYSRAVARIQAVRNLRTGQFPEDAGPMAHPVRPASYQQVSNFYTSTVYQKGAEVVRMMHTLVGPENFRKGIDLYFQRHDGQAVTTDELVAAIEQAGGVDLAQFRLWYEQAGTPRLTVRDRYDEASRSYELSVTQQCPPTPGQPAKRPMHMPLALGLLAPDGRELPLRLQGEAAPRGTSTVLSLHAETEVFRFIDVPARPVPSLGRGFSAPVVIDYPYDEAGLQHLLSYDSDSFNRWEAGQRLAMNLLLQGVADRAAGRPVQFPEYLAQAFGRVLADAEADPAFAAEALALPPEVVIAEQLGQIDPLAVHQVRFAMRSFLAERLHDGLRRAYDHFATPGPYSPDAQSSGRRALRNLCLAFLMDLRDADARRLCLQQLEAAGNMTDAMAALSAIANCDCPERRAALDAFHAKWRDEPLVVDKWLGVEAQSRLPGTVERVRELTRHPAFTLKNPNKVYALLGSFGVNQVQFHAADGSGYQLMLEQSLALDVVNPQVASRMVRNFERYRRFEPGRQALMRAALERIATTPGLSKESSEVVGKALA